MKDIEFKNLLRKAHIELWIGVSNGDSKIEAYRKSRLKYFGDKELNEDQKSCMKYADHSHCFACIFGCRSTCPLTIEIEGEKITCPLLIEIEGEKIVCANYPHPYSKWLENQDPHYAVEIANMWREDHGQGE